MNEYFELFKKTGKIEYYLKYKEEISKELNDNMDKELKEEIKNGESKDKGDCNKKS